MALWKKEKKEGTEMGHEHVKYVVWVTEGLVDERGQHATKISYKIISASTPVATQISSWSC